MSCQLDKALEEEQKSKTELARVTIKLAKIQQELLVLKSQPPRLEIREKIIKEVEQLPAPRIGRNMEILFDRYKSKQDSKIKALIFNTLFYHKEMQKMVKERIEQRKKVLINQKLEVIDGTYQVWEYTRRSIVAWFLEIFCICTEKATTKKT